MTKRAQNSVTKKREIIFNFKILNIHSLDALT